MIRQGPINNQPTNSATKPQTLKELTNFSVNGCGESNCPPVRAKCIATSACQCTKGWVNLMREDNKEKGTCGYRQKHQAVAFMLEFLFSFIGGGHIYRGNFAMAILKLIMILLIPLVWFCVFFRWLEIKEEPNDTCLYIMMRKVVPICYTCILGVWIIIDIILFGINYYDDQNGIPLNSWSSSE